MLRTTLLALLLVAIPSPALASTPEAPGVFVVGDSHIERLGPMIDRAVADEGYTSLGHLARRGWSTGRYVREGDLVERLTEHGRPDIVVISLGGNDRCRNDARYREQLEWVVARVREAGAQRIVWLGPASSDMERSERAAFVGEWHERNADRQADILPGLGVEWIDSRPMTREGHGMDGIHFTYGAYTAWCRGALEAAHLVEPPATPGVERTAMAV